jgi:eukaryotic-like serine/threonine-protein kinase
MLKLDPSLWQRAQGVFDQVVDLPRAEREAALLLACGSDDDLRDMVDGLLAADDRALPEPQPAVVALGKLVDPELLSGSRIGSFEIEKLIGAGGMGRVYLAHRSDGRVEQSVAIKTIRGAYGGRDLLERFGRERRILAKLDHPNVARFIDAGECPDGSPYVAMEFVSGTPILDYARKHKLPLRARLQLFLKVASAVDHAHRQLVVHRDLKPGNVMVDSHGEPKLLDFGIAKPLQQQQEQAHLDGGTAPEARYFSLKHAAPEQIDGEADSVSVDIYALGGLLYELLTGRMPLDLDGLSFNEARARIQKQMPAPPSSVVGADLPYARRELLGDLDRIVLHALRKEPRLRYASAAALIEDINRLLEHRPISLRASHRWYLIARFLRRHRVASAMLAVLLSVIIGAAGIYRYQRDEAIRESNRAEMVSSILTEAFRSADPSRNGGEKLTARDVMRQARLAVSRHEELDPSTRAQLLLTLSHVHSSLGLDADARELASLALAAAVDLPQQLTAAFRMAEVEFDQGEAMAAKTRLTRLINWPQALSARWQLRLRLLGLNIESQLNQVDVLPIAESLHQDAMTLLGPEDTITQSLSLSYGRLLLDRDVTRDRGAAFVRGLLARDSTDPLSVERLDILRLAAMTERQMGQADAALDYSRRVVDLAEKLYGSEHRMYVIAESALASALRKAGNLAEARPLYASAVSRAERVDGRDSALLAILAHNAAAAAMEEPFDVPQALAMTALAVDLGPRTMPADSRQMGFFWSARATALLLADQAAAALEAATRADQIFAKSAEISAAFITEAQLLAATAEARLGRLDDLHHRMNALGAARAELPLNELAQKLASAEPLIGEMK